MTTPADKPLTMICQAANRASNDHRPVSLWALKRNAAFYKMTEDQKRALALKMMHESCKAGRIVCGCWCHVAPEEAK